MTRRQKFSGYNQRELRAAFNEADSTVKKFHAIYNSGAKITEAQKEAARDSLEDRDYLSGRIDQVESGGRSPESAPGSYISGPRGIDLRAMGNTYRRMAVTVKNAATGGNETVPSDGGFVTTEEVVSELSTQVFSTGKLLSRVPRRTLVGTSNRLKINRLDETSRADGSRYGGAQAYWLAEAASKTGSKPKLRQVEFELGKLAALYYATDELLEDGGSALAADINNVFRQEMTFKVEEAIIRGTGAGQPQGILNSPALVSQAKEAGQAAATIVYDNILKMWSRAVGEAEDLYWLINRECWPQLGQLSVPVGTGGAPAYLPADGAAGRPFSTLFGRPILEMEQCSALGTVGDIILADLSQYMIVDKGGIQEASSIHVNFTTDETVFRWVWRLDGETLVSSAITPNRGSNTRSPFVALATRS